MRGHRVQRVRLRGIELQAELTEEGGYRVGALLAQWLERAAVNRKVTGSIPVGSAGFCGRRGRCSVA